MPAARRRRCIPAPRGNPLPGATARRGARGDRFERKTQFVCYFGNQLAGGGQLLAAKQLLADGVLLLQLQRGGYLIGQVLHGCLIGLAVKLNSVEIVQLQHSTSSLCANIGIKMAARGPPFPGSLRKKGLRRVSGIAISVLFRKQAAIPVAIPLTGLSTGIDSVTGPVACTFSSDFVPRFNKYMPMAEELDTFGSVNSRRARFPRGT